MKLLLSSLIPFFLIPSLATSATTKIVVVILENMDYAHALKEPAFQKLTKQGVLFSNYSAIATVSQPNYIALTSGDTHGIDNNKPRDIKARHIGDLLEDKGLNWAAYGDDYPGDGKPGPCFTQRDLGLYSRKHFPFVSYLNVTTNPLRCAKLFNSSYMAKHLAQGSIPEFSLFSPNMHNDGHDTGVSFAAKWIERVIFPLMNTTEGKNITWIFTFDESLGRDYHILTVAVGPGISPGSISSKKYNHYSLLRTFEEIWNLGSLEKNDAKANIMTELIK